MPGKVILAALLGAVTLMAWGTVFWMMLPFGNMVLHPLNEDEALAADLAGRDIDSGVYLIPYDEAAMSGDEDAYKALMERHKQGPLVQIFFRRDGVDMMGPATFAQGFAHMFGSALSLAILMAMALPATQNFWQRWCLMGMVVSFATIWLELSHPVWFHHVWDYWLMMFGFNFVGGILLAAVIAAIIRPSKSKVAPETAGGTV